MGAEGATTFVVQGDQAEFKTLPPGTQTKRARTALLTAAKKNRRSCPSCDNHFSASTLEREN